MAPVDGAGFTRLVREGQPGVRRDTPILMMTAHGDMHHVTAARDAGVDGLATKPLSIGSVLGKVKAVFDRAGDRAPARV